ncbi:hypothetical protein JTB14_027752 [Gonioctena quinquepunctata]|nr:hypothetical protein JTB14_027752 [Gonioctena quinquepunctata]
MSRDVPCVNCHSSLIRFEDTARQGRFDSGRYICQRITQIVLKGQLSGTETSRRAKEQKAGNPDVRVRIGTAARPIDPFSLKEFSAEVSEKLPRDNWLVAVNVHSDVILILRCRLFLSLRSRIRQASDCSLTY